MEAPSTSFPEVAATSKRIAQHLLNIGGNRAELLVVELQEERNRLFRAFWYTIAVAVFGVLAGFAVTALIVVLLWEHSPAIALGIVAVLYALAAVGFYAKLKQLVRDWETLPYTLEELRKDRECLGKNLT